MKMLQIILLLLLAVLLAAAPAVAEENASEELSLEELEAMLEEEDVQVYEFPKVPSTYRLEVGYRFVDSSGAESAIDYEHLDDSVTFGLGARVFRFPHRFFFEFEFENERDYFGELHYAYGDMGFFRSTNRMVHHNLDRVNLIDLDPLALSPPSPDIDERDPGVEYETKTAINDYFTRLKPHDVPAHLFFDYWAVNKKGDMQDVSLIGCGSLNCIPTPSNIVWVSQSRDVDWTTRKYTVGANGHLGPVETEVLYFQKDFENDGDKALFDSYTASGFRPAGTFPHALVPETEGHGGTVKLHSSYTGKLVATASFSYRERENDESGAEADYFLGTGSVTYMPVTNLTFFLRFMHKDKDAENAPGVKDPISRTSDAVSLTARYRPLRGLTLKGRYAYEYIDRDNAALWDLEDTTQKHLVSVSGRYSLPGSVKLEAEYTFRQLQDPAYNTEPDYSNGGTLSASWLPSNRLTTLLSFSMTREERENLRYDTTFDAKNREADYYRLMATATLLAGEKVTCSASYAYLKNDIEQDIVYADLLGVPQIDRGTEYEDENHHYSLSVDYLPRERLSLHADFSYTDGEASFSPGNADLLQPVSVASFSDLDISEMSVTAAGDYRHTSGYGIGLEYSYVDVDEDGENPHDGFETGSAHIAMVKVSKKW
jgi:hypothetical protein